ncbi:MAG: methyltransferase domain-containing protein, partial [Clostridia bacterium]|nr:methyltransferase domain-containing protein [Clostridia bacterium]
MPSKEYLETLLEKAKQYLPDWLMRDLHRATMPVAGGKARWREPEEPSFLEKMALSEMRPDKLKEAPDEEVRQAWLRLHQWYSNAKKRGDAVEPVVNAAVWVMEEFDRRGFDYDESSELVQEAKKLRDVKKAQSLEAKLAQLPQEVVVVPNFVCVVGSAATGKENPGDIDVLFRAHRDESGENFLIQADNVWLPVRKVLDPEKKGGLHFIDSPQGSHADYIPCYSLVLRREGLKRQVVKGAGDPLEDWEYLLHHMHEPDDEAHHCVLVDHLGNKYRIEHLDHGGEIYHVLAGLERGQEVLWSEEEARKAGLRVPCAGRQLKDVEKADALRAFRLDLGCGDAKPEGYVGIDKEPGPQVDVVYDLEQGIPYPDNSADEIRANHVLEHLADKEKIMAEIHRVLKPGGRLVFEVPSTKGEGAFNHPGHKSFWNKSSFVFWTQDDLLEGRPKFEIEKLEEVENGDLVYVRGVLRKPETVSKAVLVPFEKFTPPKPSMAGYTEAYTIDELLEWAKNRWPIAIEPKHNGFRCIAERKGNQLRLWFEGQYGKDQLHKFPAVKATLEKLDKDFILDCDLGMLRDGKRVARPDLMKFNAEKPEFAEGEEPVLTVFDVLYWGEDLGGKAFRERREVLESIKLQIPLVLSPLRWCKSAQQAKVAARWAFAQDRSEGLVAKSVAGTYETGGATDEWFKLKRVIELKVIVLDVQRTKAGDYNYWGGLLPSVGMEWRNTRKVDGNEYIDLGKTFSTNIRAKIGDIITCEVLELIPDEDKKELAWLGARVVDVDATRKEPYTAAQAIDVAKRGQVLQKAAQEIIPSAGPKGAKIAFVGASPGPVEAARGKPFVGPSGETLNELYLKPLGLDRREVFLTNAVPVYLTDDQGRVREPTAGEIEEWRSWLEEELNKASPQIIVALGQTVKSALGDRADFVLPHPEAVRRFGDSGEVARKIRQIRKALEEA